MNDKTDPRLMLLDTALGGSADGFYVAADALLADLDAADRAAGISCAWTPTTTSLMRST